jgi:hypothetical protein
MVARLSVIFDDDTKDFIAATCSLAPSDLLARSATRQNFSLNSDLFAAISTHPPMRSDRRTRYTTSLTAGQADRCRRLAHDIYNNDGSGNTPRRRVADLYRPSASTSTKAKPIYNDLLRVTTLRGQSIAGKI